MLLATAHPRGGLEQHTSVDDLAAMEIGQAIQDSFSYFSQHLFPCSTAKLFDFSINTIETATFTVFHRNGYGATRIIKSAIVFANMLISTLLIEGQFALDLLLNVWIRICCDNLSQLQVSGGR